MSMFDMRDWNEFDKFEDEIYKYMPDRGEGETKASQICTAVNKLVYKWYNDGDVYDNQYSMEGWWNDLSSYANWLAENTTEAAYRILLRIQTIWTYRQYTDLLYDLCEELLKEDYLKEQDEIAKVGSIYDCSGPFEFVWSDDDDDEEEDEDDDYEEDEEKEEV